ncbi:hypothetical protein CSA17_02600 [bacterium DOLJORAL78_65_58]|nr:MAG: hypothetical protein CSB20_04660 [bacterium DOLZORAL124_64_63]PIE76365.1 MAG: hypothetical protein CSA17_02600 [bacterium DOLJORAL78_65_58]
MAVAGVPRSALILLAVLVLAGAALLVVRGRHEDSPVLGGALFPADLTVDQVEGFLVTRGRAQYRFTRGDDGLWRLGGALTDFVDGEQVALLLTELLRAEGGPLLPGTEPEDRRYAFNGPESIRLTLLGPGDRRHSLALGDDNPVTGTYYASGLERPGCFPVSEVLRQRLAGLPDQLRLRRMLPFFRREAITRLEVAYGPESLLLEKENGRWWLREPADGLTLSGHLKDYDATYTDRRRTRHGRVWRLAGKDIIERLIYEVAELQVQHFYGLAESPVGWDGKDAWRRVVFSGRAINPDSLEADPDRLEITFGYPLENGELPARRRGQALLASAEAGQVLGGAVQDLLEGTAFTFRVAAQDSLRMGRDDQVLLAGHRGPTVAVGAGSQARPLSESWRTDIPTARQRPDIRAKSLALLAPHMVTDLDRLEILRVLPTTRNAAVLQDREQVFLETEGAAGSRRFVVGYLVPAELPAGSPPLAAEPEGDLPPVGLWEPATGRLLQVPGYLIVTFRNMLSAL